MEISDLFPSFRLVLIPKNRNSLFPEMVQVEGVIEFAAGNDLPVFHQLKARAVHFNRSRSGSITFFPILLSLAWDVI